MKIVRGENERIDSMLRRLNHFMRQSGILEDYKNHTEFVNKRTRRKLKAINSRKRIARMEDEFTDL